MCKTTPVLILLFTGYLCNTECTEHTPTQSHHTPTQSHMFLSTPKVTKAAASEQPLPDNVSETRLSTLLVAGISILFVFLFIVVIIGVWCAWKKSKERLAQANAVPSGEPGLFLKRISVHENKCESPFERALQ